MKDFLEQWIPNVLALGWYGETGWGTAIVQTLFMTFWSAFFGGIAGLFAGIGMVLTGKGGIHESRKWNIVISKTVDVFRAIPFIILLAFVAPFTKALIGTQIGAKAALVPLSLGVFPFFARQVQVALETVNPGIVEAAQSVGASTMDIVTTVYLKEARAELLRVSTVTVINLIGLTAMAGAVGAGGLGTMAISYGYDRFNTDVTVMATVLTLLLVLIVQLVGDVLTRRLDKTRVR